MWRCVVDLIAENSMFSSDVRLFFRSQPTTAKLQQSSTLFMEHILNGSNVSFARQILVAYMAKQLVATS